MRHVEARDTASGEEEAGFGWDPTTSQPADRSRCC